MKNYKIIMLGPPGSGKGTQANLIAEQYGIEHIATGDIFRIKKNEDSDLGRKIKDLIDNGHFVPDDITIKIVREKLASLEKGYVLDGFPRNIFQAKALKTFSSIDYVIYLNVSRKILIERLYNRLMCACGESFNKITKLPKVDNKCDKCGKELYQREDEKPEIVEERLGVYKEKTQPLLNFYKDILVKIDGEPSIPEVFEQIKKIID